MLFTLTWVNYTSPAIKSRVRVWGAYQSTCKNVNLPSSMVLDLACVKYNTSHKNLVCARLPFQEHQTVKMSFPYSGVDYVLVLCHIWGSLSGVAKDSSLLRCKAVSFGVYCSGSACGQQWRHNALKKCHKLHIQWHIPGDSNLFSLFFVCMFQCTVEGNMPLFLRCLTKWDS